MTDRARKNLRTSLWMLLFAAAMFYGATVSLFSQESRAQASMAGTLDPKEFYDAERLSAFYDSRAMKPVWIRGYGPFQPRVTAVMNILETSWTHGLNPAHYRIEEIKRLSQNLNNENRLKLDLILSDAVIRYSRDLSGMRGQMASADRKVTYWREPLDTDKILTLVADSIDPVGSLKKLEPSNTLYQALRAELVRLAAKPRDDDFKPIAIKAGLKPGESYPQIPAVRARLGLPPLSQDETMYDEPLAVAVMALQKSYGIDTDGVIAGRTLELVNMTNEAKMMQIIANMERLRWIDSGRPDKYVLVNIPSATLWAVEGGDVKLEMPVIVGKTARPTYSFKTEITGVRFNPNWTVPPTIKNQDFLPALRSDPNVLTRRGIRLTYRGKEVDPSKVDWKTVTSRGLANVSMVQNPGDDNPLGKVRVIMENPYNIYLHDTNHREMFEQGGDRTLSSGCIRVSQPEKLADFILSGNEGWSWNGMEKMIDSGRMRDVRAEETLPVYITYQTVWLDSDGRLVYGRDVYGQDAKLTGMLKKANAIHIPQVSEKQQISL